MRHPTPTFTPRSRAGADALASADAAGAALEATGRRVRFVCGAVLGFIGGFFIVSNMEANEPLVQGWLDATGLAGYWALMIVISLVTGFVAVHWWAQAWRGLKAAWEMTYTR